jgi:hypothetical protein
VKRLASVDKNQNLKSSAAADLRDYVYFSCCRKIQKRLHKKLRIETQHLSLSEFLDGIDRDQVSSKIQGSSNSFGVPSMEPKEEDWMVEPALLFGIKFTLTETMTGSTPLRRIQLDTDGVSNLLHFVLSLVRAVSGMIGRICQVHSADLLPKDQVQNQAVKVRRTLLSLRKAMHSLRVLLTQSLSFHQFLGAIEASSIIC